MGTQAILYARYSPRPGAQESLSAEKQLALCQRYCEEHGWEVAGAYADEGISGARADNRPGFQAAIEDACRLRATLVVYSLSRFARSTRDAILYVERLEQAKAGFAVIREQIDTSSAVGRMFFRLISVLAEFEREQTAERTSEAMQYHQSQGRRMSRYAPYGYMVDPVDPAKIVEDPMEQAMIDRVCDLREDRGMSLRKIAQAMMDQGIPFRGREQWHFRTVKDILNRAGVE